MHVHICTHYVHGLAMGRASGEVIGMTKISIYLCSFCTGGCSTAWSLCSHQKLSILIKLTQIGVDCSLPLWEDTTWQAICWMHNFDTWSHMYHSSWRVSSTISAVSHGEGSHNGFKENRHKLPLIHTFVLEDNFVPFCKCTFIIFWSALTGSENRVVDLHGNY